MNEVPELVIGGIFMAPIVIALVELAKRIGMKTEFAPWLNGIISVLFYGVTVLIKERPDLEAIFVTITSGLLLFLFNAGVYDTAAKNAIKTAFGEKSN